jgi:hypothetical protein
MNYHVDNGQFRGLAFANFRHPFEADAALAALNGYDLQGRRLRVEYKRVLRAGEKERIERDKAIKRMRSAVGFGGLPPPPLQGMQAPMRAQPSSGYLHDDYEDYGTPIPSTLGLPNASHLYGSPPPVPAFPQHQHPQSPPPLPPQHHPQPVSAGFASVPMGMIGSPPSDSGVSSSNSASIERCPSAPLPDRPAPPTMTPGGSKVELDMNDAQTLEIYSRVLLFKEDSMRDELAFARVLSATQRRTVHLVAQKLSLDHASVGEGESRHVVVYKPGVRPPPPTERHVTRSASRGDLRAKRSAPDLRSRRSAANVRHSGYGHAGGVPNVPSLPNLDQATVTRQPRGPDPVSNGFNNWRARPTATDDVSSSDIP